MPRFNFQKQFAAKILSGEKTTTIRKCKRVPKIGDGVFEGYLITFELEKMTDKEQIIERLKQRIHAYITAIASNNTSGAQELAYEQAIKVEALEEAIDLIQTH